MGLDVGEARNSTVADQINPVAAAWLRWRLMDDAALASWFVGPDCMLCKDSKWTVKQKMLDKAP